MGSRSESVRRWWQHRRALLRVSPGELVELQRTGVVSESLKPYAALAQEEALALENALGGEGEVSEQRLLLIQDIGRLGLMLRAVVARFLQGDGDPELASRVASLASARRASLALLGLDRVARELDLAAYLEQAAENRSGATNGGESDESPADAMIDAPAATEGGARPGSTPSPSGRRPHTPEDRGGDPQC